MSDLSTPQQPPIVLPAAAEGATLREWLLAQRGTWAETIARAVWEKAAKGDTATVKMLLDLEADAPGEGRLLDRVLAMVPEYEAGRPAPHPQPLAPLTRGEGS